MRLAARNDLATYEMKESLQCDLSTLRRSNESASDRAREEPLAGRTTSQVRARKTPLKLSVTRPACLTHITIRKTERNLYFTHRFNDGQRGNECSEI